MYASNIINDVITLRSDCERTDPSENTSTDPNSVFGRSFGSRLGESESRSRRSGSLAWRYAESKPTGREASPGIVVVGRDEKSREPKPARKSARAQGGVAADREAAERHRGEDWTRRMRGGGGEGRTLIPCYIPISRSTGIWQRPITALQPGAQERSPPVRAHQLAACALGGPFRSRSASRS